MFSALGIVAAGISKIHQSVQVRIGYSEHMPTASTVTPIGSTEFLVFFVPERHTTIATITGRNVYIGFIDELHGGSNSQNGGLPRQRNKT